MRAGGLGCAIEVAWLGKKAGKREREGKQGELGGVREEGLGGKTWRHEHAPHAALSLHTHTAHDTCTAHALLPRGSDVFRCAQ